MKCLLWTDISYWKSLFMVMNYTVVPVFMRLRYRRCNFFLNRKYLKDRRNFVYKYCLLVWTLFTLPNVAEGWLDYGWQVSRKGLTKACTKLLYIWVFIGWVYIRFTSSLHLFYSRFTLQKNWDYLRIFVFNRSNCIKSFFEQTKKSTQRFSQIH